MKPTPDVLALSVYLKYFYVRLGHVVDGAKIKLEGIPKYMKKTERPNVPTRDSQLELTEVIKVNVEEEPKHKKTDLNQSVDQEVNIVKLETGC